jgi:isochorismate hydrolase
VAISDREQRKSQTGVTPVTQFIALKNGPNAFPDQKPIDRTFINTWEDAHVVDAVTKTGRKKLVMAALWSEICLAMLPIQAAGEGYQVYAVTDASWGVTVEAHEMAVRGGATGTAFTRELQLLGQKMGAGA